MMFMQLHQKLDSLQSWLDAEVGAFINQNSEKPVFDHSPSLVDLSFEYEYPSLLDSLPLELKHQVCASLPHNDLASLSQVSQYWSEICGDDAHWRNLFRSDRDGWNFIESSRVCDYSMWSKVSRIVSSAVSEMIEDPSDKHASQPLRKWKNIDMRHHIGNSNEKQIASVTQQSPNTSQQSPTGKVLWSKISLKMTPMFQNINLQNPLSKTHRVPMMGDGLDSTSKDLLYSMMFRPDEFKITGLHPGVEGMGSGIGFCVDKVYLNIAALHRAADREIFDKVRPQWLKYFQEASGLIYVVNSKKVPDTETSKLKQIIGKSNPLVSSHAPLLVLLVSDEEEDQLIKPSELADMLNLDEVSDRIWCIRTVNLRTLDGMLQSLQWLASKL